MTIRRFVLGVTIVGVIGGVSPALAEDFDLQAQDHDSCIVEMTGDVNLSGTITTADILYLVAYVFIRGLEPLPCSGAGDVNCSGVCTTSDIIFLVKHVFKSGPLPCDICLSEFALVQNCIQ